MWSARSMASLAKGASLVALDEEGHVAQGQA